MPDLGATAIRRWYSNLPPDVRAVVTKDPGVGDDASVRGLVDRLTAAPIEQAASIIRQHDGLVAGMGRARRVRLLAWLKSRIKDDSQIPAFSSIFEEGDGDHGGEGASRPISGRLFFEDVRLLVEHVIAPRRVRQAVDPAALEVVTRSAYVAALQSGFEGGRQ